MGKSKKSDNKNVKYISVGAEAYSFYDPSTGINICRGEVKELTSRQYNSTRVKRALVTGHLVLVSNIDENIHEVDVNELQEKFNSLVESGMEVAKIAEAFTLEEITHIAENNGVEVEEGDTVTSIIEALMN